MKRRLQLIINTANDIAKECGIELPQTKTQKKHSKEVIKLIYSMQMEEKNKSLTMKQMALMLNSLGHRTPHGKKWTVGTVNYCLNSSEYGRYFDGN